MEKQLLFLFSAIGALNGFFISIFFAFIFKNRNRATYFLAALLFAISVRVTKSVFFTFSSSISNTFLHIGLTACLLIGPLLYLYIKAFKSQHNKWWLAHIVPILGLMIFVHFMYPYHEYRYLWQRKSTGYLGWFLFLQWVFYIVISARICKTEFKRVFKKEDKVTETDYWAVNIILGVFLIWLAYFTTNYTSYIVGAVSFSFVLYLAIFMVTLKKKKGLQFLGKTTRYEHKKIDTTNAKDIITQIDVLFKDETVFTNPEFKIGDLAKMLNVSPHYVSQILNDNLNINFPNFINSYRIKVATKLITQSHNLTIEGIGKDSGFKSKATFYKAFKAETGVTPAVYKKNHS